MLEKQKPLEVEKTHNDTLRTVTRLFAVAIGKSLAAADKSPSTFQHSKSEGFCVLDSKDGRIVVEYHEEDKLRRCIFFEEFHNKPNNFLKIQFDIPIELKGDSTMQVIYTNGHSPLENERFVFGFSESEYKIWLEDHIQPIYTEIDDFIANRGQDLGYSFDIAPSYLDLSRLPYHPPSSDNQS